MAVRDSHGTRQNGECGRSAKVARMTAASSGEPRLVGGPKVGVNDGRTAAGRDGERPMNRTRARNCFKRKKQTKKTQLPTLELEQFWSLWKEERKRRVSLLALNIQWAPWQRTKTEENTRRWWGGGGAGEGAPNSFPRNTQGAHFGLCCPLDFFLTAGHVKGLKSANVVQFSARLHKRRVN